jgi:hypothetical protein
MGMAGSRGGQTGQDTTDAVENRKHLPNSSCEIIMSDDVVYKTRVEQYTSMYYFKADGERFVRD